MITDSWHIVNRVCNEIINYSVISVNCKKLIIECANAGIDSFEKEIRYEKIAIEKYSVEEKRSEKVLEMYEVSRELSRIERLGRVEKLRKRAIEIERERNLKMVGEIVVEILRKMEKVRREETRLEMKEIKEEIRRLMRLEKARERES